MEFYIRENEHPDGPYDLMAVIRKIRNGNLKGETLVSFGYDDEPKPAREIAELSTFFEEGSPTTSGGGHARVRTFSEVMHVGMDFLRNSVGAIIFSAVFMVLALMIGFSLIYGGGIIEAMFGITLCYFLLGGYMFGILRYIRGNPLDIRMIASEVSRTAVPMGVVSLIVGMLMLPGLVLTSVFDGVLVIISLSFLFIALFVVLSLFAFAPLLIVEKRYDFWDAVRESIRVVRMNNNLGIVFALVTMNFILMPLMLVVLPVTMGALVELYDEYYY